MINNVVLVGRTTKAIELKQNVNGTAYARFTLAVNRPTKDQNGNSQADFIRQYMTEVVANKITFLESKRSQLPEPQEPFYVNQTQEAGVNHTDPLAPGYTNPFNPNFNDPNFNPNSGAVGNGTSGR